MNTAILVVVVLCGALLLYPRLANARLWRATITPLASIIGSGFLVIGPILQVSFGYAAPIAMLILAVFAYLFGSSIRFNIRQIEILTSRTPVIEKCESLASAVLAFAYVISVAYYLNLFGAFGVSLTELDDAYHARLLTSAIFVFILIIGWTRGFTALERLEQIAVGLKLAIIAGLLFGLVVTFGQKTSDQSLFINPVSVTGWSAVTLIFGLIVTVQGFETSRYLAETYDAKTRIRSMQLAQVLSTGIYLLYIIPLTFIFPPNAGGFSETAIIGQMAVIAPIISTLLVVAALSAQFSAAVADTSGSGGLVAEITQGRVTPRVAYAILVGAGLLLTWKLNVFQIIGYASRAFAAYYAIQAGIAAISAGQLNDKRRCVFFVFLALLGAAIALFGKAIE